jgi:hypothetical protein
LQRVRDLVREFGGKRDCEIEYIIENDVVCSNESRQQGPAADLKAWTKLTSSHSLRPSQPSTSQRSCKIEQSGAITSHNQMCMPECATAWTHVISRGVHACQTIVEPRPQNDEYFTRRGRTGTEIPLIPTTMSVQNAADWFNRMMDFNLEDSRHCRASSLLERV